MNKIIVYTIGCPKCVQLERKLEKAGISFVKCCDVDEMKRLNILTAPYMSVNGKLLDFRAAWKWIDENKEK